MNRIVRLVLALGAIFVGGAALSACGGAIPGDSVAVVAGSPITKQALAHWSYVAALSSSQQTPGAPLIIPDPPTYTKCIASLKKIAPATIPVATLKLACQRQFTSTLSILVRYYWIQGQAAAQGLKETPAQVQQAFQTAKAKQFKTAAAFQLFLTQTGYTLGDILYRFRISALQTKLATPAAISAYYHSNLAQFSTQEHRNIRLVLTKTLSKAKAAKAALAKHHSWQSIAKKYSTDAVTKNTGGLLVGVTNGQVSAALNQVIFAAPRLKLLGPIKTPFGYYVAEVIAITPASQQSLAQATPTIKATLAQNALTSPPWLKKWKAKTTCRSGFEIPDCNNYHAPKPTSTTPTTGTAGGTVTPTTSTGSTTPTVTRSTATAPASTPTTPKTKKK